MKRAFHSIQVRDKVKIRVPNGIGRGGQEWTEKVGRVVMYGCEGVWVLDMGGKHGTPGICTPENFVKIVRRGGPS